MTGRRRSTGPRRGRDAASLELFPAPAPDESVAGARAAVPAAGARAVGEPHDALDATWLDEGIPGATPASAISVATLTRTAKDVLEGAFVPLWVRGEVTDFRAHRNGHWYFCLRDGDAQIRCVVWSRERRRIPAAPDDGMQVAALGQLTVYAARGDMQLSVLSLEAEGDGLWRKAMEMTIARLEADGLLAPERKRPLPRWPRRVAVVTSPDGAAMHDVAAVSRRRCPGLELVVVPAAVQGDGAPDELCAAIERAGRWGEADVLIVTRGGGGREDLWAFNDERVARALAACPIPTVSAVGHEIDVTVCDLVADLRAPTPSAAAEAVAPLRDEMLARVRALGEALEEAAALQVRNAREALDRSARDVRGAAERLVERRRAAMRLAAGRLEALSPLATLARGYAIARDAEGRTVRRASQLPRGARFSVRLGEGAVDAESLGPAAERSVPVKTQRDEDPGAPKGGDDGV